MGLNLDGHVIASSIYQPQHGTRNYLSDAAKY
jgi:hypothetical protein